MNKLAQEIAQLLDRDPIMAAQIQEHLTPQRLREVLDLPEEAPREDKVGGTSAWPQNALDAVLAQYELSDVIAAYNKSGGLHG